ncbi:MAG: glycosyl hydrolase [Kiritimatiellia bacterium]
MRRRARPLALALAGVLAALAAAGGPLWERFAAPPPTARPWCYWWWVNGHADRETITADLEAMARLGFGGVLMFDSRGYWEDENHVVNPPAEVVWGSEAWYDRVEFALRECARLGLTFTMNASASGGTLNGFADGREYEVDVMNRAEVRAHLERVLRPLLDRAPELVGTTFTHVYSVSYEGSVKTGGSWRKIGESFYATMREWAAENGLKVFSEAGGPWFFGAKGAKLDCDQLDLFAGNDFPQGEFWPLAENCTAPEAGHANANGRFFIRAPVLAARRFGRPIVSMEAFTHMHRHWTADPAFLKPLADMAYADGVNRLVWHTFTCSPVRFGVPGAEYFAGTHINRNVTWHREAGAFVGYLTRCQALLQTGESVDDGCFAAVRTNYHGWGRHRIDAHAPFTWAHRRAGEADWFFVAGESEGTLRLPVARRGRTVEFWDPVAQTARRAAVVATADGATAVRLRLPKGGSAFVVFGEPAPQAEPAEVGETTLATLDGPWRVAFAYHPGIRSRPPAPVVLERLADWTSRDDLRHFSGRATYETSFELSADAVPRAARLVLGEVPSGLARVTVNGRDCGIAWCPPWAVDVAPALRAGRNEVRIDYVNNWHNRLVGDCALPEGERVTRSTVRYWNVPRQGGGDCWRMRPTPYSGPSAYDPLQPSGLLGPVAIRRTEPGKTTTETERR